LILGPHLFYLFWITAIHPPQPEVYQLARLHGIDPVVAEAVAMVESTEKLRPRRSKVGACGLFQTLGGRYGNLPCPVVELFPVLSALDGARLLAYFKKHCGLEWYLPAYNGGWANCCGGSYYKRNKDRRTFRCSTSYRWKVRQNVKRRAR